MVLTEVNGPEVDDFESALLSMDQPAANRLLLTTYREGGPVAAFNDLVIPALVRIGSGWEAGDVALAQVYMSGRLCQQLIADLPAAEARGRTNQPKMAIGILEDSHVLGKQIVVQMLLSAGYSVTDWGARLSVEQVIERVAREQIDVLFLSVLMLRSALMVAQVRQGLSQRGLHPVIVVGGAPFRFDPDLSSEVGADYVGRSASDVLPILAAIEASR
jgi:methanogenic corrinoid protein MtbC1